MLLATVFRAAGCVVVDTNKEQEIEKTLGATGTSWVLVTADGALSLAFRDAYPGTPIIQLGGVHQQTIAGRISMTTNPHLGADVHGLVSTRDQSN